MFKSGLMALLLLAATAATAAEPKTNTEKAGDVLAFLLPATAAGMALNEEGDEAIAQYGKAFAVSAVTTQSLKWSVRKQRPNGRGFDSFPSGHTAMAMSGASMLQQRYGWSYGVPAYLAAAYVGYSRVYAKKHYRTDVAVGAAIGILPTLYFVTPQGAAVEVALRPEAGGYSLAMGMSW